MKGSPGEIVSDAWEAAVQKQRDLFSAKLLERASSAVPLTPEQEDQAMKNWAEWSAKMDALQAEWAAQAARERDAFKGEIVEVREDGGPHVLVYADGRRVRVYLEAPEWIVT